MAYRCALCGIQQRPRTASHLTPIETRQKEYSFFDQKRKRQRTSKGWEIVREVKLCLPCNQKVLAELSEKGI